jgi:hypothetical protein
MTPPIETTQPQQNDTQHSEYYVNRQETIMYHPPKQPGGGPPCIWDNGPTQRNGSCYICVLCGSTSACG